MEIKKYHYKSDESKTRFGLNEDEKKNIMKLKKKLDECQKAFDCSDDKLFLLKSGELNDAAKNNQVYPDDFIDELNIIEKSAIFINTFRDPSIILNILVSLKYIFNISDYAIHLFISSNPSNLLLLILQEPVIQIRITIYQIMQTVCRLEEGIEYIITSPLIEYCFNTIIELFEYLEKDTRAMQSDEDAAIQLLNILIKIVKESPQGTKENIGTFVNICDHCINSQRNFIFLKCGVKILAHLLKNEFFDDILNSNLFSQIMIYLQDERYQSMHKRCLKLATYITYYPVEFMEEYRIIEQIPIEFIMSYFIRSDDKKIILECINILLNIVILGSDFLDIYIRYDDEINEYDFNIFMNKLINCMNEGNLLIIKRAFWLVWNMFYVGTKEQLIAICNTGILDYLEDSCEIDDDNFIINIMIRSITRVIGFITKKGLESTDPFDHCIDAFINIMKCLYDNNSKAVSDAANAFLNDFYSNSQNE